MAITQRYSTGHLLGSLGDHRAAAEFLGGIEVGATDDVMSLLQLARRKSSEDLAHLVLVDGVQANLEGVLVTLGCNEGRAIAGI